jgi:hypothetical protein
LKIFSKPKENEEPVDGNTKKEELAGFLSRLLRRKVKERPLSSGMVSSGIFDNAYFKRL